MHRMHIVTGATGFVGAALVGELLRRTDDAITVVVRPGGSSPTERFRGAFAQAAQAYGFDARILDAADERCRAVAGDLMAEGCGVKEQIRGATDFWHCAASLRYENRFVDEIRATNVEGTRRALDLAHSLGVEVFNYMSTAYVAGSTRGPIHEELLDAVETNNHYERSKCDAERLVAAAVGFRKRILRPSIVIGHSSTRAATAFSGFYGFLRLLVQFRGMINRAQEGLLERTPLRVRADPGMRINLVAVDSVVEQAVQIALSGATEGIFHLTHPSPPTVGLMVTTLFRAVGLLDPVFVEEKDDFGWLERRFDKRLDFYGSYLIGDKHFDRSRSDAVLGRPSGGEVIFDEDTLRSFSAWYLDLLEYERARLPVQR
jgi:nucleoside-diphosphate-sugar epimerase